MVPVPVPVWVEKKTVTNDSVGKANDKTDMTSSGRTKPKQTVRISLYTRQYMFLSDVV